MRRHATDRWFRNLDRSGHEYLRPDRGDAREPRPGYGDDRPAASAQLDNPQATGVDGSGNLLIVDAGNGRVREVSGQARTLNR